MANTNGSARRKRPHRIDELQALVGHGDLKILDLRGKEHVLQLLTLADLADWEKRFGQGAVTVGNMEAILYLLWLALRGENKSDEEKDRGEWAHTEPGIGRLFTAPQLAGAVNLLLDVMVASGWLPPEALEGKVPDPMAPSAPDDIGEKPPPSSDVTPELASATSGG